MIYLDPYRTLFCVGIWKRVESVPTYIPGWVTPKALVMQTTITIPRRNKSHLIQT